MKEGGNLVFRHLDKFLQGDWGREETQILKRIVNH